MRNSTTGTFYRKVYARSYLNVNWHINSNWRLLNIFTTVWTKPFPFHTTFNKRSSPYNAKTHRNVLLVALSQRKNPSPNGIVYPQTSFRQSERCSTKRTQHCEVSDSRLIISTHRIRKPHSIIYNGPHLEGILDFLRRPGVKREQGTITKQNQSFCWRVQ